MTPVLQQGTPYEEPEDCSAIVHAFAVDCVEVGHDEHDYVI